MGLPTPGFDLAVVDEDGNPAAGRRGRRPRHSASIPTGRSVSSANTGRTPPRRRTPSARAGTARATAAGVDADGYFWFVGRADDVINSSAYRIGPFEVESALVEHPAVVEAAVVGKPDPIRGEIVLAFVVLAKGYTASESLKTELQEHVKHTTAPYKYPREIEFVDDLPKTVSGKIRRVELRQRSSAP